MSTLIISEKPSLTRALLPLLPAELPTDDTYVAHTMGLGIARFKFSRGRPMSNYPLIVEPQLELDRSTNFYAMPVMAYASTEAYGAAKAVQVPEILPGITRIIYACDPDHTGIWAFRSALELWAGYEASQREYEAWRLIGIDEQSLREALTAGTTTAFLDAAYQYAKTKRYFEFQWTNNAHVVLGAAMRLVAPDSSRLPSKFGLQLLYKLRERCLGSEGQVIQHMQHWTGTGKYPTFGMGSVASRGEIVSQLREMGLISKGEWAAISGRGEALLAALHPDCEDRDLPQRLDAWGKAGFDASQVAIDRYIRTVFGKQLRFAAPGAESNQVRVVSLRNAKPFLL